MKKHVLGATIGNCVHVAGVIHFLDIAREEGYCVEFLGAAIDIESLFSRINLDEPGVIAIGYRLTPENLKPILDEFSDNIKKLNYHPELCFGGTKPAADIAREYGIFSFISDGYDEAIDAIKFFRGENGARINHVKSNNIISRIDESYPYPLLRHHFGRPTMSETITGIEDISKSCQLDIISLGPDQNAQQYFFHPEMMNERYRGAGGVPIRTTNDLIRLKKASMQGNYPLMRCYSGTSDVFMYADLLKSTIDNAWAAIPLYWYNELDGRGTRPIEISLREAQQLIKWHADRNIPVELNEPHHWGLRDAHDVIPVVMSYISALNAKELGVKNYIAQYMFNNPNGLSFSMDMAKILAMIDMAESLRDGAFKVYRETRAGLALFHPDPSIAKGQLSAATFMQMAVKPHIIHIVGFSEADHAAKSKEVIESCKIVKGVIKHSLNENFGIISSDKIIRRKNQLISEAWWLIEYVKKAYNNYDNPLTNPDVLVDCVKRGIFDAVHIRKNDKFTGNLYTKLIDGMCLACNKKTGKPITEKERIDALEKR